MNICVRGSKRNLTSGRRSWNISSRSTKSGAREQLLLPDCGARASPKGVFLFTDTGSVPLATVALRAWP